MVNMKKKLKFNNTYNSGTVSYLFLKEKGKFVAVCLEFDLETEGKTFKETQEKIEDLTQGWWANVVENKLSEELLNKSAPKKYWKLYETIKNKIEKRGRITARILPTSKLPFQTCNQIYNSQFPLKMFLQ